MSQKAVKQAIELAKEANAKLTVLHIYPKFAGSPYETWQTLAWAGALVLTLFVLLVSLGARALLLRNKISND